MRQINLGRTPTAETRHRIRIAALERQRDAHDLRGLAAASAQRSRPVSIRGHHYPSTTAAALAFQIPHSTVRYRVRSAGYPAWHYL